MSGPTIVLPGPPPDSEPAAPPAYDTSGPSSSTGMPPPVPNASAGNVFNICWSLVLKRPRDDGEVEDDLSSTLARILNRAMSPPTKRIRARRHRNPTPMRRSPSTPPTEHDADAVSAKGDAAVYGLSWQMASIMVVDVDSTAADANAADSRGAASADTSVSPVVPAPTGDAPPSRLENFREAEELRLAVAASLSEIAIVEKPIAV